MMALALASGRQLLEWDLVLSRMALNEGSWRIKIGGVSRLKAGLIQCYSFMTTFSPVVLAPAAVCHGPPLLLARFSQK
jgi:hypothetical protein